MTTIAHLEMLLSNLPSDIVSHIHNYSKHPIAELFKEAMNSGKRCIKHPALHLIERCLTAYASNDFARFIRCDKLITFHSNRNAAFILESDMTLLAGPLRELYQKRMRLLEEEDFATLYYSQTI